MNSSDFEKGDSVTVTFNENSFIDGSVKGDVTAVRDSSIICEPTNIAIAVRFSVLFNENEVKFLMGTKGNRSVVDCEFKDVKKGSVQTQKEKIEDVLEEMEQEFYQGSLDDSSLNDEYLFFEEEEKTLGQQQFTDEESYLNSGQNPIEQEDSYKFAQAR